MINFVIVHFNTPELITCLCSSINKRNPNSHIIVFDNSDVKPFINHNLFNVEYYDNTKGQIIDFDAELSNYKNKDPRIKNNYGSAKHAITIDYLCKNLNVDSFVLLDSDVLIKRSIDFCDDKFVCISDIQARKNMNNRFIPFVMYLNTKKNERIKYKFF